MNVEGMLPYENKVAEYVRTTGNHVLYRVSPVFEGNNLLCSGVKMEAYSVEDAGKGICFNVYCFNVQPGVDINYEDGSNTLAAPAKDDFVINDTPGANSGSRQAADTSEYVANKNTRKFHYPSCDSVSDMKEKNKWYFEGTREELIDQGYVPCKRCNP